QRRDPAVGRLHDQRGLLERPAPFEPMARPDLACFVFALVVGGCALRLSYCGRVFLVGQVSLSAEVDWTLGGRPADRIQRPDPAQVGIAPGSTWNGPAGGRRRRAC